MPCHEPAKASTSWPPVSSLASRSAASFASPPVERNIARASGSGSSAISSRASSVTSRERKPLNRCTARSPASRIASRIAGWPWPSVAHIWPEVKSRIRRPSSVVEPAALGALDEEVGELAGVADQVIAAGAEASRRGSWGRGGCSCLTCQHGPSDMSIDSARHGPRHRRIERRRPRAPAPRDRAAGARARHARLRGSSSSPASASPRPRSAARSPACGSRGWCWPSRAAATSSRR